MTESSWEQPESLMVAQQNPSVPSLCGLGTLQTPALSSGVVPLGHVMPWPPPEQSSELSSEHPAGAVKPALPLALAVQPPVPAPTALRPTPTTNAPTTFQR
jgi:hypothetical protein